jgi:hypothetical protein
MLGGWLHRHTCFVAAKVSRAETRRKAREQTASELNTLAAASKDWNEISGVVDEAVNELHEEDRAAILLRFLEGRPMRSVGEALGISEDAAQKRTHRAVEKLKLLLERKGVVISVAALGTALATEAAAGAVPVGLGTTISSAALSGAAASSFSVSTVLKAALLTRPGTALLATAILCTGIALVVHKQNSKPLPAPSVGISPSRVARDERRSTSSPMQVPAVTAAPQLTMGEEALNRLKEHIAEDDAALMEALYAFWNKFETAPESDRASFRTAIPLIAGLWERKSGSRPNYEPEPLKHLVLTILTKLHPPTDRVIDIYIEALGSTNENIIEAGISGLKETGPAAAKAVPAIIEQLQRTYQDRRSTIPGASLAALASIGPDAAAAVPMLTSWMQDTNNPYRIMGVRAYWFITKDSQPVLPLLTNALLNENSFWAADILGEMGSSATPALDSLREAYRSGSPDVRMHAYKALLTLDPYHAPEIQGVQELLDTRNPITRLDATEALWQYSHDTQLVLPLLIKVLPEREDFFPDVNRVLKMLGQMGPDATEALPAVRKILEEPTGTTITRMIASNTWAQISPGTPVPAIVDAKRR